ncbi:MAG: TMEM165/GDT1 family protein [Euryarchaeota archaeon]|nr:TMEM165/GDT1 family protein [Euryarchaeota archaeon]MDE1835280.1 TMEM165/GDT1 family protein [Euryarchaeota archaeon]MDE1881057.1 TMEM165/GDT1 family protein [Euryarchaeota archaeon]MDE2043576.1 TMEM165/GDT1 family protein [Thermoplasmata archaeon]
MGPVAGGLVVDFATVFGLIFIFEVFDRTNFAVIGLSGKHRHTIVWAGAAVAFVVSTAISVAIGEVIVSALPAYLPYVKILGGAILVAFGVRGLLGHEEEKGTEAEERIERELGPRKVWLTSFSVILFLEMGDNTQILTIVLIGQIRDALLVFVAASLALVSVATVGATSGNFLKTRVPAERLERVLSLILILVGAATLTLGVLELAKVALPTWL